MCRWVGARPLSSVDRVSPMSGGSGSAPGAEVYVAEVMATFVRYFVAFLFLEGLYLRPDTGATNMRRDRPTRVSFRPRTLRTYASVAVRSFVRSFETNIPAPLLYPQ